MILRYLDPIPGATASMIHKDTGIPMASLMRYIRALEEAGAVVADVPLNEERRGKIVIYKLDHERVRELVEIWRKYITSSRKAPPPTI